MSQFDVFISYASADIVPCEVLENWLQASPRNRKIWRDRRGIPPGSPDYYRPISEGIAGSAAFLILLSPNWLRSRVAKRELSDALTAGKKVLAVVHPSIAREPITPEARQHKTELMQTLDASELTETLGRANWIWLVTQENSSPDFTPIEQALATDFPWAARHTVIVQRLDRWKAIGGTDALLRGMELADLISDAFAEAPGRLPVLTEEQRNFLLESHRHEALEREKVEALFWGAQSRASAFAARERGEAEPDLALLLAAEAVTTAPVPEARAALCSLLHRYAPLTALLHGHAEGRRVGGVAFSRDGRWLASTDQRIAIGDDRPAYLIIHDVATGQEVERIRSADSLGLVAWGQRWLAVASPASIGWVRWDDWKEKFRGNTSVDLSSNVTPDYLAFSHGGQEHEMLAWGTRSGDIGLVRVADHLSWQGRLNEGTSTSALEGLGWLPDGRLITLEAGRLIVRPVPDFHPAEQIASSAQVLSLVTAERQWIATAVQEGNSGFLIGEGTNVTAFVPSRWAGKLTALAGSLEAQLFLVSSSARRTGEPSVAVWSGGAITETLLQGQDEVVVSLSGDPERMLAASGEMMGRVWLWDRKRRSHLVSRLLTSITARTLATSHTGVIGVGDVEGRVRWFDPSLSMEMAAAALSFSPSRLFFVGGTDELLAWQDNGSLAHILSNGGVFEVTVPSALRLPTLVAAAASPTFAALLDDHNIVILELVSHGLTIRSTIHSQDRVLAIRLNDDSTRLFAVVERLGLDVISWRLDRPAEAASKILRIRSGQIPGAIAFLPGDRMVVADGFDLAVVSVQEPQPPLKISGHDESPRFIISSGEVIASVASWFVDLNVDQILLSTPEGAAIGPVTLPEHVHDAVVSCNGSAIVALGLSGHLWRVTLRNQDWVDAAHRLAGRDFTEGEQRRYGVKPWHHSNG
jgi:WD40 repeat protein